MNVVEEMPQPINQPTSASWIKSLHENTSNSKISTRGDWNSLEPTNQPTNGLR